MFVRPRLDQLTLTCKYSQHIQQAQCAMPQSCDTESRDLHALALQFLQAVSRSHLKPKACANKRQEDFTLSLPPARLLENVITLLSGCFLRQGWCSLFPALGLANSHTSFSVGKTSLKLAGQSPAFSHFLCND